MSYGEDQCRVRKDHAAINLAVPQRIGLSLLKNETSRRAGIKNKRQVVT